MTRAIVANLIEEYNQKATYWSGSMWEEITNYSTDRKGKWGEQYLRDMIKEYTDIPVQWDGDCNTNPDDGTYDLFWYLHNGKKVRVEVKTSGRTVSKGTPKGWQHENVYFSDNKWDKLVFVDYDTDDSVCFTILNYDDVVKEDSLDLRVINMGYGHVRKNEQGKAKVDTHMKQRNAGIASGVTFRYDYNNPQDELLGLFLINKLSN